MVTKKPIEACNGHPWQSSDYFVPDIIRIFFRKCTPKLKEKKESLVKIICVH